MSNDELQTIEQVKSHLTKQAFGDKADQVTAIRNELAKSVFDARKNQLQAQKATYEKRRELIKSIESFWPATFEKSPLDDLIEEADKDALASLTDLDIEWSSEDPREFTATFSFKENDFFKETELKKSYTVSYAIKKESPYELDAPVSSGAAKISWKSDAKNLVKKSPKPDVTKLEEYDEISTFGSFFNVFSAEEVDSTADLLLSVFENALDIYSGITTLEDVEDADELDEEDEEDGDDAEEVDLGDSETDMPKKKKQKK